MPDKYQVWLGLCTYLDGPSYQARYMLIFLCHGHCHSFSVTKEASQRSKKLEDRQTSNGTDEEMSESEAPLETGGGSTLHHGKGWKDFFLGGEPATKEEQKLVQKLDTVILTWCCCATFFNYLDRSSFANAYVAGLREDVALEAAQYNYLLSCFTAGSVVGQIPHAVALQKVAPRVWLPSMMVLWACLTMACGGCATFAQLAAVRFLQGIAEGSTYCGTIYILGCWYKPREMAKRVAVFTASGQAGTMFAGLMMTAMYRGSDGLAGWPGWRWLFVINGAITLPVAIAGVIVFPDLPESTRAWWLCPEERALALARLPPKDPAGHNISPASLARRVLLRPALYVLLIFSVVTSALEAYVVQGLFLLWMKFHADVFSQSQINKYPLGVQGVGIVATMLAALHIDASGRRLPMGLLAALLQFVATALLLARNLPHAAVFFAFYLSGTSYMVNPVAFGWASIILKRGGDDAARAVIVYAMNVAQTTLYIFWGILLYPAGDAPYWRNGYMAMLVVCAVLVASLHAMRWLDRHTMAEHPDWETAARDLFPATSSVNGSK